MITVQLNQKNFEYDVHSLVKAFYPEQEVKITYTQDEKNVDVSTTEETETPEEAGEKLPKLVISFVPEDAEEKDYTAVLVEIISDGTILTSEQVDLSEIPSRKEIKNQLKRLLYRQLSVCTGRTLPWGTLTGIRPTKIPMSLLESGWKNSDIAEYLRNTYYTSNEKTALAVMIANKERHVLQEINFKDGYSLYVGIPFCPSICLYCSFSSSPIHLWKKEVDTYLDALCRELDYTAEAFAGKELNTVYIGGGTPTTLEPYQLDRLLTKIEENFSFEHLKEFTVEAGRPDSITREKLEVLRRHGITRISINPQTMNQSTLDLIGRRHTVEDIYSVFRMAREMGFDNINMDLIVGLPGEDLNEVEHTMQALSEMSPDNITVHSLAVKRAARLRLFKEEHKEMTMTNNAQIMDMTARYAQQTGLFPYYMYRQKNMAGNFENVGYAAEGKEGIYNILIMEEVQTIVACGAGTVTKRVFQDGRIERCDNVKDVKLYISKIDEMIDRKRRLFEE